MLAPAEKTVDLRELYDTKLLPRLATLERERLRVRGAIISSVMLIGIPMVTIFCGGAEVVAIVAPQSVRAWIIPLAVVALIAGVGVAFTRYALPGVTAHINYRARFKNEVVAEIFKAVMPSATYSPHSFIKPSIYNQSRLFEVYGELRGDDLVRGRIGETPFEACEMGSQDTDDQNKKNVQGFRGIFFHLDFNKVIHGQTIVQPQNGGGLRLASRRDLQPVTLENPVFAEHFEVFSTNPVEARYILTPLLMERIVDIHTQTNKPVCLSFVDNRAFVAVHYGRHLFEPKIASTTSYESIAEMASLFGLADTLVRELDLNTRIWTKDVDARLLDTAPATDKLAELSTGNLTVEGLLKTAVGYQETDTGPPPVRPANARATVERYSDTATVRYRFAWWAMMTLIMSLPFIAAALLSLALLIDTQFIVREVFPLLDLPDDATDALLGGAGIVLAVSMVVGGFISMYWITYVRSVVIDANMVRVKRGLSPFAHYYPRSVYTRVLQMDNYVYLGRADVIKLVNPSLSPMLKSVEEGRWVAAEIRRAMQEIGGGR